MGFDTLCIIIVKKREKTVRKIDLGGRGEHREDSEKDLRASMD